MYTQKRSYHQHHHHLDTDDDHNHHHRYHHLRNYIWEWGQAGNTDGESLFPLFPTPLGAARIMIPSRQQAASGPGPGIG